LIGNAAIAASSSRARDVSVGDARGGDSMRSSATISRRKKKSPAFQPGSIATIQGERERRIAIGAEYWSVALS
jgi:hypothetical protein